VATVPVGLAGLALDKIMREYLGRPIPAAVFLLVNGVVLLVVGQLHRGRTVPAAIPHRRAPRAVATALHAETVVLSAPRVDPSAETVVLPVVGAAVPQRTATDAEDDARLARLGWRKAVAVGACQVLALLPGISRSGAIMAGGLLSGLSHSASARFAFLLATPVIAAAGLVKLPELARPEMQGAVGPTCVGSVVAGIGAYLSVRFLTRYFHARTLTPFAVYCLLAGLAAVAVLTLR
jgi:undecaprenyl-diphosphatase